MKENVIPPSRLIIKRAERMRAEPIRVINYGRPAEVFDLTKYREKKEKLA